MNGLAYAFASWTYQRGARSWATVLGPWVSRRVAASTWVRPARVAAKSRRTWSPGRALISTSRSPTSRVRLSSSAALRSRRVEVGRPGGASFRGVRGVSMVMANPSSGDATTARQRGATEVSHGVISKRREETAGTGRHAEVPPWVR